MAKVNINRVVLSGNLTKDPEKRETGTGSVVTELRLAVNSGFKRGDKWESKPNYFQVNCWGKLAENCAEFLSKGSPIALDGRLEWQSWENKEGGTNSRVVIVADSVEFLNSREKSEKSEPKPNDSDDDKDKSSEDDDVPF